MTRLVVPLLAGSYLAALVALAATTTVGLAVALALALGGTLLVWLGPTRLGTLLIVLGFFTAPMNSVRPIAGVDLVTFSDVFLAIGVVVLLPALLTGHARLPARLLAGALLMSIFWVVGSFAGPSSVASMGYLIRMLSASLLLPVALLLWRPPMRTVAALVWAYVWGQGVSTIAGLAQGKDGGRYVGLTTHPNFYGMCGALAFGLCLHLISVGGRRSRSWAIALLALSGVSVLLSGSRAALLATALVMLVYPLLERSARAGYLLALSAGLVLALGAAALLPAFGSGSAVGRLTGGGTAQGSDAQRTANLLSGLHQLLAHPVVGVGFSQQTAYTHNGYLEIAQATGLLGLLGYLIMLSAFVGPLFRGRGRNRLAYAGLAYLFISTFNNTVWDRFAWTAILLGALADATRTAPAIRRREPKPFAQPMSVPVPDAAGGLPWPDRFI